MRTLASTGIAFVCAQRDGVPRLRAHDKHHVSGIGGGDPGLHSRQHADLEDSVRRRREHDACGDGLHRQRTWRIESREHRHQLAGNGRGTPLPRLHRWAERRYARGTYDELAAAFQALVDDYIAKKYPRKTAEVAPAGR